ncbi:hypothetical protein [Bacillus sp. DHT2]|nr:hypothetical protein [Bacillus sp. DHT2]
MGICWGWIDRFAGLLFLSASYLFQTRKLSTRLGEVLSNGIVHL